MLAYPSITTILSILTETTIINPSPRSRTNVRMGTTYGPTSTVRQLAQAVDSTDARAAALRSVLPASFGGVARTATLGCAIIVALEGEWQKLSFIAINDHRYSYSND